MILYPAIDLKGGQCVRLQRGDMDKATVFNPDPVDQAAQFAELGFDWLHMVDLDGAFSGKSENGEAVHAILQSSSAKVQLGGGLRTLQAMEAWLRLGINRVILGTIAVKDPDLVHEACRAFPGQIALGIDASAGWVAVEGWAETSNLRAIELAKRFEDAGASAIIYTDIDRDGMLQGLNFAATRELATATRVPVIASGGLASIKDIETLVAKENQSISGAIIGRAFYEGKIDAEAALAMTGKRAKLSES